MTATPQLPPIAGMTPLGLSAIDPSEVEESMLESCPSCGSPRIVALDGSQIAMTCDSCPPDASTVEAEQLHVRRDRLNARRQTAKAEATLTYGHDLHAWRMLDDSTLRLQAVCRRCGSFVNVSGHRDELPSGDAVTRHCQQQVIV